MSLSCLRKQQQRYGASGSPTARQRQPHSPPERLCRRGLAGQGDEGGGGEGPSTAGSGEGARRRVMSAFPSGSVMCACQVNSLEIDGRKAADGACSRAGGALPSPFPPRCRPRRRLPLPSAGRWEQRGRTQRSKANPLLSCLTALKCGALSGRQCWWMKGGRVCCFQAAVAADLLHPLPCWRSPGEAGESPGREAPRGPLRWRG